MPVYEYLCGDCGAFEAIEPMSRSAEPNDCPACGATSPRVMVTAPSVSLVSQSTRVAHLTNERSADSPKRTSAHGPVADGVAAATRETARLCIDPTDPKVFRQSGPG